jgi:hypothetical protein
MCIEAVRKKRQALQYVPDSLKTVEMCLEALMNNDRRYFNVFQYVPDSLKTAVLDELIMQGEFFNSYYNG